MLNEVIISNLENLGAKRWQKGNMDRLYINAKAFMEIDYYKTGNICSAWFDGNLISNCRARRLLASKTYIDIKDGSVHSDSALMEEKAEELLSKAKETKED